MKIETLYRYERASGKITVSPKKPDKEYTEVYRLIADDGKMLTQDNVNFYSVVDTDEKDGWVESDYVEEVPEESME